MKKKIDPLFDGHLEKDLSEMNTKEKLMYLSYQIYIRDFIKKRVEKIH